VLAQIRQKLGLTKEEKEVQEREVQSPLAILNESKSLFRELKIDFEDKEVEVRQEMWIREINLLIDSKSGYKVDVDEFKALDAEF